MSLSKLFRKLSNDLAYQGNLLWELIYPRRCAVCKNEIDIGYFCESCRQSFELGKELTDVDALDKVILLYKYQQQLQLAIHGVKFEGKSNLLPFLREEAQLALNKIPNLQELLAGVELITCVPTSPKRKQERGFEVPQELFAFLDNGKLQPNLLKRVRNTMPLFDLEPSLRRQEVAGCFEVQCSVVGKSVLICDDIYTTGSTMCEAAQALRKAGATKVIALAFTASKDNW